ncbi:MAG TPA: FHA domain-containing protein [Polyangiaceae bacterium]|nr:FHA domain-containing protein [Polyangiaceae bacterium]
MEQIDSYLELARRAARESFVAKCPGFYLLKRPRTGPKPTSPAPQIRFETWQEKMEIDPFAAEWRIAPVRKKPDNPFPERLVVGRAPNCDVVLRVPFISKVHAHIMVQADGLTLVPGQSQKVQYNYRPIEEGGRRRLLVGDHIAFGALEFAFVDSAMLYDILRTEVR